MILEQRIHKNTLIVPLPPSNCAKFLETMEYINNRSGRTPANIKAWIVSIQTPNGRLLFKGVLELLVRTRLTDIIISFARKSIIVCKELKRF
jgi:hypothetical protein